MKRRGSLLLLAAAWLAGCEPLSSPLDAGPVADAGASPNASILPSPLATESPDLFDAGRDAAAAGRDAAVQGMLADSAGRLIFPEAGAPTPPEVLRPDEALAPEPPSPRDLTGVTLEAVWRWRDVPPLVKTPETSVEGIKEAQKLTALTWKIDLTDGGRMRIEFTSRALPLPLRSEIRARSDHYGSIVLWPNATQYRVIAKGALRPVLGERRVDVTPLAMPAVVAQGDGKRLGVATRKVELTTSLGSVKLEIGKVQDAGEGGALLCRALVELIGVDPKTPLCQPAEVPLLAAYTWRDGGGIGLEVTSLVRRTDLAPGDLVVPPQGAAYSTTGLPVAPSGIFLTRAELAAFRSAPVALPARDDPSVPGEGFVAVNHADMLAYVLLDGVPVVAVPAGAERYVIGTARGRYVVQWRTFLGDRIEPALTVELPARLVYGAAPDAGAPDGG